MSKQDIEYTRKGKVIKAADGEVQAFKSINRAKAWSREWQQKNGGLGKAGLVVEK